MAAWDRFFSELMPEVPGCPYPMAQSALRESAREFFARTRAWREWFEPVTVAGRAEYDLEVPSGAMVIRIERATANGQPLQVLSSAGLMSDEREFEQEDLGIVSRDRVSFTPTRSLPAGSKVAVFASLMPTKTSAGIPDALFAQHCASILAGAKYRLMLTPGAEFQNPDLAALNGSLFKSDVAREAVTAWRGATGSTPRARVSWC